MKDLGYGRDYKYDPDQPHGVSGQSYLPEGMEGMRFYEPGDQGWEVRAGERLAAWRALREKARGEDT